MGSHDRRTRGVPLDGRIAIVTRGRANGPFALLLAQADDPWWVVGRVVVDEHLGVIRVVFDEKDEESGEDEGENAGAEEGYEVPEGGWESWGRGKVRCDHGGEEQE